MSATDGAAAKAGRSIFRVWMPFLVLALGLTTLALVWGFPAPDWDRAYRVSGTWLVALATGVGLLAWLLCFSGLRWWIRLSVVLALAGVALGSIHRIAFTGDMAPVLQYRWSPPADDVLEAHRRQHGVAPVAVEATGSALPLYPAYRGSMRDGIVAGPPLARDWNEHPPPPLWTQPAGGGYASFAIRGNAAVTIEQRRKQEAVVCYDTDTGRERWVHSYAALFDEALGGDGPRATPTLADADVYSLGATGRLVCLDLVRGQEKWSVEILKNNDNIPWGMSGSPLVYDRVVVVNPGTQTEAASGRALVAYDRATGKQVWSAGSTKAGYSSPMLATLAGRRQVLLFDGEGLGGYDATDGKELWRYPWLTHMGINAAQPVVLDGDRVFVSSGYAVGCALLHITEAAGKWSVASLWKNTRMRCKFTSPVARDGYLYGLDDGILVCLDARTGERKWKGGRYGHGQLLRTADLLVLLSEDGELALVKATPDDFHELGRFAALNGKTWNYPALADGKIYVRNHTEMACYELTLPAKLRGPADSPPPKE